MSAFQGVKFKLLFVPSSDQAQHYGGMWNINIQSHSCDGGGGGGGGGWNRVPLYTEVSSFQGVGIEEFHCIQRCPH